MQNFFFSPTKTFRISCVKMFMLISSVHLQMAGRRLTVYFFLQFTGRWYEMAVLSTCPHYMQRKKRNPVIFLCDLQHVSSFRNGTCMETLTVYSLTSTTGRFFHHIATDVDSFVIHTNYDEYALMLQLSTEQPSGNKTTTVKLYGKSTEVSNLTLTDKGAHVELLVLVLVFLPLHVLHNT
uniref:Lipocalin/cytosolic fatty-acid binding domain-containing protein n=1 Tax=Xiphophorus couchianus TaxID=32473 RepID=A0A3B5LEU7_9TELE